MWTRKLNYLRKDNKIDLTFKSYFLYTDKRWLNTFLVTITYISTPSTLSRYMPKNWGRRVTPWHSTIYCTWEKEKKMIQSEGARSDVTIQLVRLRCLHKWNLPTIMVLVTENVPVCTAQHRIYIHHVYTDKTHSTLSPKSYLCLTFQTDW